MCGIVGYLGKKSVVPLILEGLARLEYRGYDSAGIATLTDEGILEVYKRSGKLVNLKGSLPNQLFSAATGKIHVGIGHTRWATHGAPTDENAHPHTSGDGNIALIHNGIIENYGELRETLIAKGYKFRSKTDTECVVHLLEDLLKQNNDIKRVLFQLTSMLKGAYALVIMDKRHPDTLYGIRHQAPLVVGVGEGEMFLASDPVALAEHTNQIVFLNDGQIVEVSPADYTVFNFKGEAVNMPVETIASNQLILDKRGYKHYMLKEIHEQPEVIRRALSDRLHASDQPVTLLEEDVVQSLKNKNRVMVLACGTSLNAGLVGKYFIEELARLPVDVESAGEFRYRNALVDGKTLVIAISQSGETADTITAVRQCLERGATVISVTNREDSTIARLAQIVLPVYAGLEVSVCATKSFTAQVLVMYLLGIQLAEAWGYAKKDVLQPIKQSLQQLPTLVESMLSDITPYQTLAKKYGNARDMFFIARGINFPVALEGALKLKEISYIHAEGYSASELKHGPIAMLDSSFPVLALLTPGVLYDKMMSNCQEAKARDAKVIAVNCGPMPEDAKETFDDILEIPLTDEWISPLMTVVPLQLLSYYIADFLGKDVDQPRNLAKSVTVE